MIDLLLGSWEPLFAMAAALAFLAMTSLVDWVGM